MHRRPSETSSLRLLPRALLGALLLLLVLTTVPPHVTGRCFGVPGESGEPEVRPDEPAWTVTILVATANGFSDSASFGIAEGATDGFEQSFDIIESGFYFDPEAKEPFTLLAFFYFEVTPETATESQRPGDLVGLDRTVTSPREEVNWTLRVAYFAAEPTTVTLRWNVETVLRTGWDLDIFTPFGEVVYMGKNATYSFTVSDPFTDFAVRGRPLPEPEEPDLVPLAIAFPGYLLGLAAILWLRHLRKRRQKVEAQRAERSRKRPRFPWG